jgi:alpha-galactosidase
VAWSLLSATTSAIAADRPPTVASNGDAFIAHQAGSEAWSIGSGGFELVVGFGAAGVLTMQRMSNLATGRAWNITQADVTLTLGGNRFTLASSGPITFDGASAESTDHGVQLTFTFESRSPRVRIERVYASFPGTPTIETWTRVVSMGGAVSVSDLIGWEMTVPLGRVKWLNGLRGDAADRTESDAFQLVTRDLEPEERIEIGAEGRSSEQYVPFVTVDDGRDQLFAGFMWSGSWQFALERRGEQLHVTASFPPIAVTVSPERPLEQPHTFFGMFAHSRLDEAGALREFIMRGIRHGRPIQPLVTFNTWYGYGTRIDEQAMVSEMERAAAAGIELFVIDAGWWSGAGANGRFDFESGLGAWTVDSERFPSGLKALAEQAHNLGMKFGLWLEPEHVSFSMVNQGGLADEEWLATREGEYGAPSSALICLGVKAAREWMLQRLVELMEEVRPDYLKWDNNFWINCDRDGHDHGPEDGNMAHVQGLYEILAELRSRYPDLLIENVSGGGARLDFGMLAYTDVGWMNDRTTPSTQVRHDFEGLSAAFPPGYLLAFVIDSDTEQLRRLADLPLVLRSRMPGVLGFSYRAADLGDIADQFAAEIQRYKTFRDTIARASATLLSAQAPVDQDSWDIVQEMADAGHVALIFAFKCSADEGRVVVRPVGLQADATYAVYSADAGLLGTATGEELMQDGIEIMHSATSRAHMLVLTAQD